MSNSSEKRQGFFLWNPSVGTSKLQSKNFGSSVTFYFLLNTFALSCLFFISLPVFAETWSNLNPSGSIPSARYGQSMVRIGTKIYLFGGSTVSALMNDLYVYDISSNTWNIETPANSSPQARKGHRAVSYNDKMYIFFGQGSSGALSDIWSYDPQTKNWTQEQSLGDETPSARFDHGVAVIEDIVYLYGGTNTAENYDIPTGTNKINLKKKYWEILGNTI